MVGIGRLLKNESGPNELHGGASGMQRNEIQIDQSRDTFYQRLSNDLKNESPGVKGLCLPPT